MVYLMRALLANLQRQYLHFVGIRFLFLFNVSLSFCDRLLLLRYQIKSQQQLSLKSYLEITFFYFDLHIHLVIERKEWIKIHLLVHC